MRISFASENFSSRSHDAVIRVYDDAVNVIEKHEHKADIQDGVRCTCAQFKLDAHSANPHS
jgi:hypothetical protein